MSPPRGAEAPPRFRSGDVEPSLELDHLVVACGTLAQGHAWCEATFGVAPEPGGRHALMGTHNLLLAISSARFPRAYLELIAIDADGPAPTRPRWFDLDDPALQATLDMPRLVHWVARTRAIEPALARMREAGHDPGAIVAAERMTPRGPLRWRITLSDDGRRPGAGAVPLLIEWGDAHPTDALPDRGISLESLRLGGVSATLAALLGVDATPTTGLSAAAPSAAAVAPGASGAVAPLRARLIGRRGPVELVAAPAASGFSA